jgi:uncharacterized tellurite resistance protein B-like protein
MSTRSDALALLKVLIAAAWADSRLSQSEINYIKTLMKRFHLKEADWIELEPWLEDAPTEAETEEFFRELLARIASPGARAEVVAHLEEMMKADAKITAEEHDFLEQYAMILRNASTVELLVRRMRGLFARRQNFRPLDLDEFLRNKILFKLRRRIGDGQITPDMYRLCLLGGLMGVVARADNEVGGREMEEVRKQIEFRGKFDPEALDVLMTIIEEESVRGLDRARLIAEYTANAGFDERIELLDLLFAVAAADGGLKHAELEELRAISAAMHLSHKQYIDAKLRSKGDKGRMQPPV